MEDVQCFTSEGKPDGDLMQLLQAVVHLQLVL